MEETMVTGHYATAATHGTGGAGRREGAVCCLAAWRMCCRGLCGKVTVAVWAAKMMQQLTLRCGDGVTSPRGGRGAAAEVAATTRASAAEHRCDGDERRLAWGWPSPATALEQIANRARTF